MQNCKCPQLTSADKIGKLAQYSIHLALQDRRVIIWSNSDVNSSSAWTPKVLNTFDDVVWHLSWSVSGNMLAVSGGDNKITLWKENLEGQWICISDGSGAAQKQAAAAAAPASATAQPTPAVQPVAQ